MPSAGHHSNGKSCIQGSLRCNVAWPHDESPVVFWDHLYRKCTIKKWEDVGRALPYWFADLTVRSAWFIVLWHSITPWKSELCASGCLSRERRLYLAQGAVHSSDNEKIVWFLEEVETILLCLDLSCTTLGKLRNGNLFEGRGCKITLHRASRLF